MSENNYSVDDILKEYTEKKKKYNNEKHAEDINGFFKDNEPDEVPVNEGEMKFEKRVLSESSNSSSDSLKLNGKTAKKAEKEISEESPYEKPKGANLKPLSERSGNTAIIEGLLKMKKEKGVKSATAQIPPVKRAKINDIELDIKGKVIPKTQTLTLGEDATDEEKQMLLDQQRKKKISEFILQADEVEPEPPVADRPKLDDEINDFTSFEQAPEVMSDITSLKGNLIIRMIILSVSALLSIYLTFANDLGWPIIDALSRTYQPIAYLFTNVVLGLISAFVCYTVLSAGLTKLISFKADSDSLAALTVIASLVSSTLMLTSTDLLQRHKIHVFIPVAIISLLFNTLGKLLIVNRAERNFRYVSGGYEKHAVTSVQDEDSAAKITKGAINDFPSLATMRKTEFVEDFIKNSYSADMSDSFCKYFVPIILGASLISAIISIIFGKELNETNDFVFTALGAFTATISMCSAVSMMLVVNLPLSRASKKYLQSSGVMLGYSAVDEFADTNSILVDVSDLFPEGMIDFVNLKAMSSTSIEDSILTAASLACQANSIMSPAFYKMLRGKTELLFPVESYIYEDGLGLSGWIENKRVLLGTRELMLNHSIDGIPPKTKEDEYAKKGLPLYLSISGVVTALFVIRASASVGVAKWLKELEKSDITIILRSVDAVISLSFISKLFGISPDCLKLLPFRNHKDYEEQTGYKPRLSASMLCSGKFSSLAMLVVGAKRLQKTSALGITFQMAGAVLGTVICIIFCLLAKLGDITCTAALLYNLAWSIAICVAQAFKKL